MRRVVVLALAAALAGGCSRGGDEPTELAVTTPGPSATAGTGTGAATATPPPTAQPPTAQPPAGTASGTAGGTATAAPAGPRQAYQVLATDWQRARGVFFTAISDGRRRPVAQQRTLAASYLTAQKAFATELARTGWPAAVRPAVRALLAVNREQQANIAGMATAGSSGEFAAFLGRYGTLTGKENAAVTAVAKTLG